MRPRMILPITAAVAASLLAGTAAADVTPQSCETSNPIHYTTAKTGNRHMPGNATHYKDGPGGDITITSIRSGSTTASLTGTVSYELDAYIVKAKAEISSTINKTTAWSESHTYHNTIPAGKYGNVQYGSWGFKTSWTKWYLHADCIDEKLGGGTGRVPTSAKGFKWWVTDN